MAARYHNITKASKELFVTQPSVSNAIKALEEEFGVNLFYRNNNKLTLTPEVDFHLYEYGSVKACEQVLEKKLDLAIVNAEQTAIGAFLYRSMVETYPDIIGIPVFPSIEQRIGVIWRKGKYQNVITEKVIKYLNINQNGRSVYMTTVSTKSGRIIKVVSREEEKSTLTLSDYEMDERAVEAVKAAINKAKICKKPIAGYDKEKKRAYVEYANGERKYAE